MTAEKTYGSHSIQYRAYRYWMKHSGVSEPKQLTFCYLFWVTFLLAPLTWLFNHVMCIRIPFTKAQIKIVPISILILLPLVFLFVVGITVVFSTAGTGTDLFAVILIGFMITGPLTVHTVYDMTLGENDGVFEALTSALLVLFSPILMPVTHIMYFWGLISLRARKNEVAGYENVLREWLGEEVKIVKWEMPRAIPVFAVLTLLVFISSPGMFISGLAKFILGCLVAFGTLLSFNFFSVHVIQPVKNKLQGIKEKKQQSLAGMLLMGYDSAHRKVCPLVSLEEAKE